jgi:hypothetical protein
MKNILLKLLENISAPRIPHTLKSSPGMMDWLKDQTQIYNPKNSSEMVYIVLNGPTPLCACGNRRKFNTFNLGYRVCCDRGLKCISSIDAKMSGLRKNLMETYGVTNANDVPGVAEKRKATMIQNHGVEYAAQSTAVQEKMSQTMQSKSIEEKDLILVKTRASMVEKFGVSHHMKLDEQKQKVIDTNLERYGVEHPLQNYNIKYSHMEEYGGKTPEQLTVLLNKDSFSEFITGKTRDVVCKQLSVSPRSLWLFSKKYQSQHLFSSPIRSKFEIGVYEFFDSHGYTPLSNVRTIISPKEIDLYIPSLNLAVECSGLYWHSEISAEKARTYHYNKYKGCKDAGIRLITIFDDEWNNNRPLVESRLVHFMNKENEKIGARRCVVCEISSATSKDFIESNHLQGHANSTINLGLYHNDRLVSVMTFGKPRYNSDYQYELIRFCSSANIQGAASKLFTYFIKNYNPSSVISYSDNRWGWGQMYKNLGFNFSHETIGYQYTNYNHRFSRHKFQKHKLVEQGHDPSLTEWEIMQNLGYDRIWDCGQASWTWINNTIILE